MRTRKRHSGPRKRAGVWAALKMFPPRSYPLGIPLYH
jgi:hypothetical protein